VSSERALVLFNLKFTYIKSVFLPIHIINVTSFLKEVVDKTRFLYLLAERVALCMGGAGFVSLPGP